MNFYPVVSLLSRLIFCFTNEIPRILDADKISALSGEISEEASRDLTVFLIETQGFWRASPMTHRRAFQIVEQIHVKITFITLCNQLVKAISLKA